MTRFDVINAVGAVVFLICACVPFLGALTILIEMFGVQGVIVGFVKAFKGYAIFVGFIIVMCVTVDGVLSLLNFIAEFFDKRSEERHAQRQRDYDEQVRRKREECERVESGRQGHHPQLKPERALCENEARSHHVNAQFLAAKFLSRSQFTGSDSEGENPYVVEPLPDNLGAILDMGLDEIITNIEQYENYIYAYLMAVIEMENDESPDEDEWLERELDAIFSDGPLPERKPKDSLESIIRATLRNIRTQELEAYIQFAKDRKDCVWQKVLREMNDEMTDEERGKILYDHLSKSQSTNTDIEYYKQLAEEKTRRLQDEAEALEADKKRYALSERPEVIKSDDFRVRQLYAVYHTKLRQFQSQGDDIWIKAQKRLTPIFWEKLTFKQLEYRLFKAAHPNSSENLFTQEECETLSKALQNSMSFVRDLEKKRNNKATEAA